MQCTTCTFGPLPSCSFKKLAYKSKLYILSIVFIKKILFKIVTKKWKKLINSKLLKPSQISKSTTGLFSIYFSHECAHRTTHGSLRVCSQTSWTLHLEIFRMDPCSNNYFNLKASHVGLVLEFEMLRYFGTKQKSKSFTLCHCVWLCWLCLIVWFTWSYILNIKN